MTAALEKGKTESRRTVDSAAGGLIGLSHRIHAHPELAFEENRSSKWVAEALAEGGFSVEHPAYDLPTAFSARVGNGPLHLVICAEYDALPAIGHACGHNIIASAAVGAALALAPLVDDFGFTLRVLGTPAEERGDNSGKIQMLDRGAFEGAHAAMMVHPHPYDVAMPRLIAAGIFDIQYTGKEAHAAAWPQLGVNAGDALTVSQVAIGLLRQHIVATDRIHGIVTKGGDAPNVVPAHTSARYMVRSDKLEELHALRERVVRCFEAGAVATGARLEIVGGDHPYAHVEHDRQIAGLYQANAEALGRTFVDLDVPSGSTDMGNVSLAVPAIHPFIGIGSAPAVNHQPEFTAACISKRADQAVTEGAIAMAWTVLDIAADRRHRERLLSAAFERSSAIRDESV